MLGAIPLLPQYALMAWCSVKYRDNLNIFPFFQVARDNLPFTDIEERVSTVVTHKFVGDPVPVLSLQTELLGFR
jgi:hypothetical protein